MEKFSARVSPKNQTRGGNFLLFIVAIFAFSSCSITSKTYLVNSHVDVNINAYGGNVINSKTAMVICNDPTIKKYDLKNLEFESYVKTILATKGYSFTDNNDEANVIIFYEYGISDPKVYTSQRVVPVWGQTGISSSRTEVGTSFGKPYSRTTYTPSYGVVSSDVVTDTDITYVRWTNISAFDADYYRKTGEDRMLWLTEIQSEGSSDDLRYIFPFLLTAAREYIGQNHPTKIKVSLALDPADKSVLEVKNTLVTVVVNQATAGRKDPQATVVKDVYRNGELYIKEGMPVSIERTRKSEDLLLSGFSTTSVYGNKVSLKGAYRVIGKDNQKMRNIGRDLSAISVITVFTILPITLPMAFAGDYHAKVPEGTVFYLEME
ncbi:MAG: hypothetical protein LBI96_04345 [Odoribacteraceae bacterium]|jgi:hypothetical protein|nr:hypothetical protein [Odoribacteraceae bacterium]